MCTLTICLCKVINHTELINLISQSSTPNPQTEVVAGVWDFKEWIDPYLANIEYHSKYHVYRFTIGKSGDVEMHYKQYSSMPWEPHEDGIQLDGLKLLSVRAKERYKMMHMYEI